MSSLAYFDSHMHTPLCRHAVGEPDEYAERALLMGLQGIIFTCHCPMPEGFWPHVRMAQSEFETYVNMVDECRQRYADRLEVRLGIESDYFPGHEDWIEKLHASAPFHYCLGSVHWQAPEYSQKFESGNPTEFRRSYWKNLAASAETGLFDCLAHPDLIKNYKPQGWKFEDWREEIAAALDRIAKTGVAMELNTSGLHKSYSEMNPGFDMLVMMRERGIPVVLGSDSHHPRRVGESFAMGLQRLQTAGFKRVSIFENRRRQDLVLADVVRARAYAEDHAYENAMKLVGKA